MNGRPSMAHSECWSQLERLRWSQLVSLNLNLFRCVFESVFLLRFSLDPSLLSFIIIIIFLLSV